MNVEPLFDITAHILHYDYSINQIRGDLGLLSKFFFNEDRTESNRKGRRLFFHVYKDGDKRKALISDKKLMKEGLEFINDMKISLMGYNVPRKVIYFLGILEKRREVKLTFGILDGEKVVIVETI